MSNLSPSTVAINTIAHCLANALDVSAGLDTAAADDLRVLLRIAVGEVDRVRKATTAAKRANGSSGKKAKSKRARAEETEAQAQPVKPKSRSRKAEATNGLATH